MVKTIKEFIKRDGAYVLSGSLVTKLCNFFTSLLLIRILTPEEFGVLAYTLSTLAFFIPFSGGGLHNSFLRFGSLVSSKQNKQSLFSTTLLKGVLISLIVVVLLFFLFPVFNLNNSVKPSYFYVLFFYLISYFLIEMMKAYYRVFDANKKFSSIDVFSSISLLVFGSLAAYYFSSFGYLFVFVCSPLILTLFYLKRTLKFSTLELPDKYYSYGFWVGLGSIASQLMYSLDVFLIGQLISDTTEVAIYRTASIIPIALFFIPNSYITTHYTDLAKNSNNKAYLVAFSKNYLKLFSVIGICVSVPLLLVAQPLLALLFGPSYSSAAPLFQLLIVGMFGAFVLRIPFGNLLAAVGKSSWNTAVAFAILILNGILNYFAITRFGIIGAAIVTSSLFWISGITSLLLFYRYLKQLD